jgi:S-DNA-T family DNA segregation ATPase FtsK/SpoIIIE
VAVLEARAELLAAAGRRVWEPSPEMPALMIIIDEYAELAEEASEAMQYTDSIARLGRALAVTLIAATQRPTQKAMGQSAVRSQMDIRICFRVRERRDVDLILGQGMLSSGWDAHSLNAPGKLLVSAPGHDTPKRARAYLLTDQAVAETASHYTDMRPGLDEDSRRAISAATHAHDTHHNETSAGIAQDTEPATPGTLSALWHALSTAPKEGIEIGQLIRVTGMSRTTLYRYLREYAVAGRAVQVSRGRWRAQTTDEPSP